MSWKELVVSIIGYLAWPITVLVMFFLVRERVGSLIDKLGKLKYKDLELDFSKIKRQTTGFDIGEERSDQADSIDIKDSESDQVFSSLEEQIFESVENAPAAAILLAWSYIETSLYSATSRLKLDAEAPTASPIQNIQALEKTGKLSPQQIDLLHEMRVLRNRLAHGVSRELVIHEEQALDYANTAVELARFLDRLDRKRKIFMLPSGSWITVPEGFKELEDRSANFWNYSCLDLPGTDLIAGVGPWTLQKGGAQYFGIDIEQPRESGSSVVAELLIDLSYVSEDKLNAGADRIVTFDKDNRVVRFDLGDSIFEYQLK